MLRKIVCSHRKTQPLRRRVKQTRSLMVALRNQPRIHNNNNKSLTMRQRFYASDVKRLGFPALSPSMETGKIAKWLKQEGDSVTMGQIIAQVETDKATVDWEAPEDGFVAKILVKEGAVVEVNAPAVILVAKKEQIGEFANYKESSAPPKAATPASTPSEPAPAKAASPAASKPLPPTLGMPALSPTMEEGKLIKWFKKEGEKFVAGEHIAEIETDKATLGMEAYDDGIIAKHLVQAGATLIKVGAPIAIVVKKESEIATWKDFSLSDLQQGSSAAPAAASPTPAAASSAPTTSAAPAASTASGDRVIASPLAKAEASKKGIDLAQVKGTGPNGRIIAADIAEFVPPAAEAKAAPAARAAALPSAPAVADFTDFTNSNIRQITAERLTHSKQNIPHYYLTVDINMDKLMDLRTALNDMGKNAYKLSVNDFVIKAAALALRAVPEVNSEWRGTSIRRYNSVHINVAVNTPKGLFTPIVRDADKIGLKTINTTVKDVAQRAQEGKSTLQDLQIGTFTISNLGMFGITNFSAVINPPQAAILAVGGTRKVVVVEEVGNEQKFKNSNVMSVTLSCDHRVVDGAVGAQWLQVFRDLLENPMKFLL